MKPGPPHSELRESRVDDPAMPFLTAALSAEESQIELALSRSEFGEPGGPFKVTAVRLVRHKPGRRCLIEYELAFASGRQAFILGKSRAKGVDRRTYALHHKLYEGGFHEDSEDGVSVPQAVGLAPRFAMWFQKKVPGVASTELLNRDGSAPLAERIAEAMFKLHSSGVATSRRHSANDEMRILGERLCMVAKAAPQLRRRVYKVLFACRKRLEEIPQSAECGIHRDFYPDQVIVDGQQLFLVDLDLYCRGLPAIDAGNFLAHLIEQRIRTPVGTAHLLAAEQAFADRYAALTDKTVAEGVSALTTLSLARHIQLSTQFLDRRHTTEQLLELCERRLGLRGPTRGDSTSLSFVQP